jgi:hypothetical protein
MAMVTIGSVGLSWNDWIVYYNIIFSQVVVDNKSENSGVGSSDSDASQKKAQQQQHLLRTKPATRENLVALLLLVVVWLYIRYLNLHRVLNA